MSPAKLTMKERILENGIYKLVSFIVAAIVWVTVLGRRDVSLTRSVDVDFHTGANLVVMNDVPTQVDFRISGSRFAIKKIQRREMDPIRIDVSNVGPGRRLISVPDDSLRLPLGLRVVSIQPQSLFLELAESVSKKLPVRPFFAGPSADDLGIDVKSILPPQVELRGASQILSKVDEIATEKIDLSALQLHDGETKEFSVGIMFPRVRGVVSGEPRSVILKLHKGKRP